MRTRDIKPGFYLNDQLAECSFAARLAFPGLWMVADREGRLEYRPKRLKAEIFPYDNVDMAALINELIANQLVVRYQACGKEYLWIPTFLDHQKPHPNEKESVLPPCPDQFAPVTEPDNSKDMSYTNLGDTNVTPRCEADNTRDATNPASYLSLNSSESHINNSASGDAAQTSKSSPESKKGIPPDVPHYQAKSGAYLKGDVLTGFERFWEAFDFRHGKAEAADAWLKIRMTPELLARICDAARQEAEKREVIQARGQTPKWAQGWLNSRRWEDYEPPEQKSRASPVREEGFDVQKWEKAQAMRKKLEAERMAKVCGAAP